MTPGEVFYIFEQPNRLLRHALHTLFKVLLSLHAAVVIFMH